MLDGTLSGIPFFSQQILPLIKSLQTDNRVAVAQIVKKYSPLISIDTIKNSGSPLDEIRKADAAVKSLFSLWDGDSNPSLMDLLRKVVSSGLFSIPDVFEPIVSRKNPAEGESSPDNSAEISDNNSDIDAWDKALSVPFSQIESYVQYISDKSPFGTHQGIKGLQFPRVMVVLDDNEARGFMFSYDKLFGAKVLSATDQKNEQEGIDTSIDRTRRLFYVTCSRAEKSLAIIVYTLEPDKVKDHVLKQRWFEEDEILDIGAVHGAEAEIC